VVGDFDSLGAVPIHPDVEVHPAEKDETEHDAGRALRPGAGCDDILIYGGLGGRPDHSYANLQTLVFLARQGARGWLVGEGVAVTAIRNGAIRFTPEARGVVSVFAADGTARGVTLTGLKYPLTDYTMTADNPIGVSNEFTGAASSISVRLGALLVMTGEGARRFAR
jgi:thiamine pyrophosphokinase